MSSSILYRLARGLWLIVALLALGLFLSGAPLEIRQLSRGFLGMWWHAETSSLHVDAVTPGLPADRAGIRPGDKVVLVDNRPVYQDDQSALVTGEPGSHVNFLVRSPDGSIRQRFVVYGLPEQLSTGLPREVYTWGLVGVDLLFVLLYFFLAGLIIWRAPAGWFPVLAAYALILIPVRIPAELRLLAMESPNMAWMSVLNPILGFIFVPLTLSLFPDGRWRPAWIWIYPLASLIFGLASAYPPVLERIIQSKLDVAMETLAIGIGILVQVYRYRSSNSLVERRQIRWALYGITVGALSYLVLNVTFAYGLPLLVLPGLRTSPVAAYIYLLSQRMFFLPLVLIPIALAASILRFRLWDIDLIIRRTLVYTLLTTALAGIYFGLVVVLQWLFRQFSGEGSNLALILSTLAITALFAPLRARVQQFIDRRFFRRKYDAFRTLEIFAAAARSDVDLDHLSGQLLDVVDETLRPAALSLWLTTPTGRRASNRRP